MFLRRNIATFLTIALAGPQLVNCEKKEPDYGLLLPIALILLAESTNTGKCLDPVQLEIGVSSSSLGRCYKINLMQNAARIQVTSTERYEITLFNEGSASVTSACTANPTLDISAGRGEIYFMVGCCDNSCSGSTKIINYI